MSVLNNFNMSYSTYHNYKESPLMFYFQKIIKAEPTDWVPFVYGRVGNILHDAAEKTIIDRNFNGENYFIEEWYKSKIDSHKGLFNTKLKQETYLPMVNRATTIVNNMLDNYDSVVPEQKFLFDFHGVKIKGFIDVVAKKSNDVYLFDWKSDSSNTQSKHLLQRLFYSWAYWKVNGVIPKECTWIYLRKSDYKKDSFTLEDLQKFEVELKKDIDDIKSYGLDISKYPVGDYDNPFNAHKTLCIREEERRKHKLQYGLAVWGNSTKLVGNISSLLQKGLSKKLSYKKELPEFVKEKQNWDGTVYLYNKRDNSFPTGLIKDVHEVIKDYSEHIKMPYTLEYKDMRDFTGQVDMPKELIDIKLRDYQEEAVDSFMKNKYGIIKIRTGLGKTLLSAEIIRRVGKTTLWVIDRLILAEQTKEVLEEALGVEVGLITEGNIDLKDVTVCTYQTLTKRFKELKEWLNKEVGFLIVDECHKAKSKSIKDIAEYCENTSHRLGLSATPDLTNDWLEIKSVVGGVCYEMSNDDERNKQFLTDAELNFIKLEDKEFSDNGEYLHCYESYITNNNIRNDRIVELVDEHKGKNILIITKSLDHADLLSKKLNCPKLVGETSKDDRDKITDAYKNGNGFVCVASVQIVSEGWDVPQLDVLIQASAISGAIKTIQGLGRILRKAEGKTKALYYDFVDKHQRFFKGASFNRQKHLKAEGYKINYVL